MKTVVKVVGLLLLLPYLHGCMSIEPYIHEPEETDGMLIVYRKFDINACAADAIFELDGKNIAKVETNQCYKFLVSTGHHTIAVKCSNQPDQKELVVQERGQYIYEIIPNSARWVSMWIPIVDYTAVEMFLLKERDIDQYAASIRSRSRR